MITFGHQGAFGGFRSRYLKKGMSAMSRQTVDTLVGIKTKYKDFIRFFKSMKMRYKGTDTEPEIDGTLNALYNVQRQLGTVLYTKGRPATDAEIQDMLSSIELIDARVVEFSQRMSGDAELRKQAEAAAEKTSVSAEALGGSSKAIKESISQMPGGKAGKLTAQDIKGAAPELFEGGKQLGKGLLTAALGPFAGMAMAAGGGALGVAKKMVSKRQEAKRLQTAQMLMPVSEMTAEGIKEQVEQSREFGTKVGGVTRKYRGTEYEPEYGGPGFGDSQRLVKPSPKQRELGGKDKVQEGLVKTHALSLEQFFGKPAYKAKYTKEIMKLMRKIAGVKGGVGAIDGGGRVGGGLLEGMMGGWIASSGLKGIITGAFIPLIGIAVVTAIQEAAHNITMSLLPEWMRKSKAVKHGVTLATKGPARMFADIGMETTTDTLQALKGAVKGDKEAIEKVKQEGTELGQGGIASLGVKGGKAVAGFVGETYRKFTGKSPEPVATPRPLSKIEQPPPASAGVASSLVSIQKSFDATSKATIKALRDMTSGSQTIPGRERSSKTSDPVASVATGDYG